MQTLIDQPDFLDNGCFSTFQAEIAIARSHLLFRQGEYQQSLLLSQRTLANLPADEVTCRAEVSMRLGMCHILQGDLIAGIVQLQKALQLWGRHMVRRQTADVHSALGAAYGLLGNFSLAEHHFARAAACWEQLQDIWGKLGHMNRVGNYQIRLGAFSESEQTFQEILTLAKGSARSPHNEAYALTSLGQLYQRQEQYERALEMIEVGLALARQIADQPLINASMDDLAMNYLYMGDPETAQLLLSEVELQTAMGDTIGSEQASQDLARGTLLLYQHQYEQAWPYLSKSEVTIGKAGLKEEHLLALLRLAVVYLAQKKMPEVVRLLEIAWKIIPGCRGYEQLARLELKRLPLLLETIKTHPDLLPFCSLLSLKSTAHAVSLPESPAPEPKISPVLPEAEQAIEVVAHKLSIYALGEPIVSLGGEPITRWRMARAGTLLLSTRL